ncbi:hypothetical protein BY996DRAFT_6456317 [Phakopsora pachyrhizi]|nr:hypothetical protein BY996DRAFT_6456317 [Phakopsora pachyrhizi]
MDGIDLMAGIIKTIRGSINEKDVFQEKFVITEAKKLKQEKNRSLITILKEDEYLVAEDLDNIFEELTRIKNHVVCLTEYPAILSTITATSIDTINNNNKPNQKSIALEFEREEDLKLIKTELAEREKEVEIKKCVSQLQGGGAEQCEGQKWLVKIDYKKQPKAEDDLFDLVSRKTSISRRTSVVGSPLPTRRPSISAGSTTDKRKISPTSYETVTQGSSIKPRTEHEELMRYIPQPLQRLIEKIDNPPKDGYCGYTCVAWSSGQGRGISTPELIRKHLSAELKKDKKRDNAGVAGWLKMPLFGYAIS